GVGGRDRDRRVQVVGRADGDDVDALVGQQVVVVGVDGLDAKVLRSPAGRRLVDVGERDQLAVVGQLAIRLVVGRGDLATANDADPEFTSSHVPTPRRVVATIALRAAATNAWVEAFVGNFEVKHADALTL